VKLDTDEIIKISIGKKLSRSYKGYKGTFATMVYNCVHKKALPGFYYEEKLIVDAEHKKESLSVTLSGKRADAVLMNMMEIALSNLTAFPVERGKAEFSISVKGESKQSTRRVK
jgi:hypothetical protein